MPFLSVLAYSERHATELLGKRHKKKLTWRSRAWQMLVLVRRWWPEREIVVVVAERTYASLKLLDRCRSLTNPPITFITRLRLDAAALYEPAPPRRPGQRWDGGRA